MIRKGIVLFLPLVLAASLPLGAVGHPGWVVRSNANAKLLLDIQAQYHPLRTAIDPREVAPHAFILLPFSS